ncbi:MAG: trigger factor [Deltaproteobacteria bacterium]|nr:trigger factor [Deltaproteobacteria bacterium]
MSQKIEVEAVDALRRRLAVEIPAEAVSAEIESSYDQLKRSARVPGFRRGHVPRHVLERIFGDRVRAEVYERLIQRSYAEAVQTSQLPVVGRPDITTERSAPGAVLRYTATVEVKPEIDVQGYDGLEVEQPVFEVSDADVDGYLEQMRQAAARLHPVTERNVVEPGDVVTLDYEARIDGRVVGRAKDREVELGNNGFPAGFDDQLRGAAVGGAANFELTYPTENVSGELAGKTVSFSVVVNAIGRKEIPEIDAEFAKDRGDCASVEELREQVRVQLEAQAAARSEEALRRGVLLRLAETNDIPVPQALIDQGLESLMDEVSHELRQQRLPLRNQEQLRKDLEPRAKEQVKLSLLLEAIANKESVAVADADVDARIQQLAEQAGAAGERVRAFYEDPAARRQLGTSMLRSRAAELVVSKARATKRPQSMQIADATQNG